MKVIFRSIAAAAAIGMIATSCEAFVAPPNHHAPSSSYSQSLSSRAAFFGFGTGEKQNDRSVGIASSSSSSNSNALIEKTKDIIYNKSGFYSNYDADVYSEEFVFRGPYIGPLNKADYLATMDAFGIWKAIPDINPNAWGFSIDPKDPNRVWFMVRNTGTFDGEPLAPDVLNYKPNGATLEGCPETFSVIYDEDQKLKYLSVGYVADRFEGNVDGKGAAVGIFNAIGLPFPKPGPLLKFAQWFGTEIVGNPPYSYSTDNIPEWWTDERKASEGYS